MVSGLLVGFVGLEASMMMPMMMAMAIETRPELVLVAGSPDRAAPMATKIRINPKT